MKGIKKGNNKYLFLGIAVLLITVGLYFLISAIPDKSLKIEGEDFNAVSTIKSGKKVTIWLKFGLQGNINEKFVHFAKIKIKEKNCHKKKSMLKYLRIRKNL